MHNTHMPPLKLMSVPEIYSHIHVSTYRYITDSDTLQTLKVKGSESRRVCVCVCHVGDLISSGITGKEITKGTIPTKYHTDYFNLQRAFLATAERCQKNQVQDR